MTQRHSSIRILQEVANGATNDVTATKHHCVLAGGVDPAHPQELHHGLRCARNEERTAATLGQLANVDGSKPVNILLVGDGGSNGMLRQVWRDGQLDENTVHRRVIVGLGDFLEDLGLANSLGKVDYFAEDAGLTRTGFISMLAQES